MNQSFDVCQFLGLSLEISDVNLQITIQRIKFYAISLKNVASLE